MILAKLKSQQSSIYGKGLHVYSKHRKKCYLVWKCVDSSKNKSRITGLKMNQNGRVANVLLHEISHNYKISHIAL